MSYEVHSAAEIFPLMEGTDFDSLVSDIRENGQMEPVMLDRDGFLIDGRNRMRACEQLETAIRTETYEGVDVLQYVVSHNLHRRHLTDSQRAMIAAKLATRGPGQHGGKGGEPYSTIGFPPSTPEVAEMLGLGTATVSVAKRILRDGTEDLQSLASEGKVPIATAARVATELTTDEQDTYVKQVRAGADPVKLAPADVNQQERYRRHRPPTIDQGPKLNIVRPEQLLRNITQQLAGIAIALDPVDLTDWTPPDADEAARWMGDLNRGIKSLNQLRKQIKD